LSAPRPTGAILTFNIRSLRIPLTSTRHLSISTFISYSSGNWPYRMPSWGIFVTRPSWGRSSEQLAPPSTFFSFAPSFHSNSCRHLHTSVPWVRDHDLRYLLFSLQSPRSSRLKEVSTQSHPQTRLRRRLCRFIPTPYLSKSLIFSLDLLVYRCDTSVLSPPLLRIYLHYGHSQLPYVMASRNSESQHGLRRTHQTRGGSFVWLPTASFSNLISSPPLHLLDHTEWITTHYSLLSVILSLLLTSLNPVVALPRKMSLPRLNLATRPLWGSSVRSKIPRTG